MTPTLAASEPGVLRRHRHGFGHPSVGGHAAGTMAATLMTLLLDDLALVEVRGDLARAGVSGIAYDSRHVVAGDLFCCLPGLVDDGRRHVVEAVERGAVALLVEAPAIDDGPAGGLPQLVCAPGSARATMASLAAGFYGHPARDLLVVGVTGTNGKTTVAHLLGAILGAAGHPATVLGTLSGTRTTPESPDLQRRMAAIRDTHLGAAAPDGSAGPRPAVVMEVSSHALVQSRVDALHFDVAIFTNLSHDHLDYHRTMEEYFSAKASLFTPEHAVRSVICVDDPWGRRLAGSVSIPVVEVSEAAAERIELRPDRASFTWRGIAVTISMTGRINVTNALLAAECALALGLSPVEIAAGLAVAQPVPGRMELVSPSEARFSVYVDYAHTPDGLARVLAEARSLVSPSGRVRVVFGCGGDRDQAKRPLMGETAATLADLLVVTSDNPRGEDPADIIEAVLEGVRRGGPPAGTELLVEPDRRRAITAALTSARPGDVVIVAGKGHEETQIVGDQSFAFSDRLVVAELLAPILGTGEG